MRAPGPIDDGATAAVVVMVVLPSLPPMPCHDQGSSLAEGAPVTADAEAEDEDEEGGKPVIEAVVADSTEDARTSGNAATAIDKLEPPPALPVAGSRGGYAGADDGRPRLKEEALLTLLPKAGTSACNEFR